MNRTKISLGLSALLLAVSGVFAFKGNVKTNPGLTYYHYNAQQQCVAITCTTADTGTACTTDQVFTAKTNPATCTGLVSVSLFAPTIAGN